MPAPQIYIVRMILLYQYRFGMSYPCPCPGLVGPGQTKRNINLLMFQKSLQRLLQHQFTVEPIMIKRKSSDTVFRSQPSLFGERLFITGVVIVSIYGDTGLIVSVKQRFCILHQLPIMKSGPPPHVVFRNSVKLREVKCNKFRNSHNMSFIVSSN